MALKNKAIMLLLVVGVFRVITSDDAATAAPTIQSIPESATADSQMACFPTVEVGHRFGDGTLTTEMLGNAKTIVAVGRDLGVPVQGQIIALSTAYVESRLVNVDYGDRDSVGLFQQRTSMDWGSVDDIMDPKFAAESFYLGRGSNPGFMDQHDWAQRSWGDVAQSVQRSAFPDRYGEYMPLAQGLFWYIEGYRMVGC